MDWKEDLELVSRHGEVFNFNIYSATLGYSRKHVFLYTANKTESDFLRCTINTFKILGGLPKKIITDNMSAVVTVKGNKKYKHPKILALKKDTGVKIKLCKARTPQTKGKDESAKRFVDSIMRDGLLPMKRQYVHLSVDTATATLVGKRRDIDPIILEIDALAAINDGIKFYVGNDKVWLCDKIPSKYIKILKK